MEDDVVRVSSATKTIKRGEKFPSHKVFKVTTRCSSSTLTSPSASSRLDLIVNRFYVSSPTVFYLIPCRCQFISTVITLRMKNVDPVWHLAFTLSPTGSRFLCLASWLCDFDLFALQTTATIDSLNSDPSWNTQLLLNLQPTRVMLTWSVTLFLQLLKPYIVLKLLYNYIRQLQQPVIIVVLSCTLNGEKFKLKIGLIPLRYR